MPEGSWTVFLFAASSHALRAERLCLEAGLEAKLIPVPRHLSSDCGLCLRLPGDQRGRAEALLQDRKLLLEGIHDLED